ncbi:MAG: hypothetical protein ACTHK7_20860 [Aureliella sp.]
MAIADSISDLWPQLPRLNRESGFVQFPVNAELIDARIAPDTMPTETGDQFMLLTEGFRTLLQTLSRNGQLAYVETEYFGGIGGQGALVCRDGVEVMPPEWARSGTIDNALQLIGLARGVFADEFAAAGFAAVRDNEDLLELIARQKATSDA